MKTRQRTGCLATTIVASATCSICFGGPRADYDYSFQRPYGGRAEFFVTGPATGDYPDVEGDALLDRVVFPSGDEYYFFYKPVDVFNVSYTGDPNRWHVRSGRRTTVGLSTTHKFSDYDHSAEAVDNYADLMLLALQNNNLNNYVDLGGSSPRFEFTMKFDQVVMDNDPAPDDFGELLYFERGAGSGNSWMKIQAVDADGSPLGPWLVVSPDETVQTTPITAVYRDDQKMGTTSIDVSRLGVSEFQYLRVSNDVTSDDAYTGGGDLAPDFKLMVVITNEQQLRMQVLGTFD